MESLKRKVWSLLIAALILASFPSAGAERAEELLRVGAGAFKDGFYKVAEEQWRRFLSLYPKDPRAPEVRYMLGRTLAEEGKWEEAQKAFSFLLKEGNFKERDALHYWLATCCQKAKDNACAEEHYRTIVKAYPKSPWFPSTIYHLGTLLFRERRYKEALDYLRKALRYPKLKDLRPYIRLKLAISLFKLNKYKEAERELTPLLRTGPKELEEESLYWLGEVNYKEEKWAEAQRKFARLRSLYPRSSFLPYALFHEALALARMGEGERGWEILARWQKTYPNHPLRWRVALAQGKISLSLGRYKEAVEILQKVAKGVKEKELQREASYLVAWSYLQLGEARKARGFVKNTEEDDVSHYLLARISLAEGKCKEALPYLFNLVNKPPYRKEALFEIARCFFREGKCKECLVNLDILRLEYPRFGRMDELLWMKGECLIVAGKEEEAEKVFRDLLKKHAQSPWAPWAIYRLFSRELKRKRIKEASSLFSTLTKKWPRHDLVPRAALELGAELIQRGKYRDSLSLLQLASRSSQISERQKARLWMGEAYFHLKEWKKALKIYQEVLNDEEDKGSEWKAMAHIEIGNISYLMGKREEACKAYAAAMKISQDEGIRSRAKELLDLMGEEMER